MKITGTSGEVRYGYLVAAQLGKWTVQEGRLTALLLSSNSFHLSRSPLDVVLVLGNKRFLAKGVDAQVVGNRVVAMIRDRLEAS